MYHADYVNREIASDFFRADPIESHYSQKKKIRKDYTNDMIKRLAEETEIITDGSLVANLAAEDMRDIIYFFNDMLSKKSGFIIDYKTVKIKELKGPAVYVTDDGRKATILGQYDTRTGELSLNPILCKYPRQIRKRVTKHETVHLMQDIVGLIGEYAEDYGPLYGRNVIETQAEVVAGMYSPEEIDSFLWGISKNRLARA
jgi:hypothetical protein